jgi:predicted DsbA family dithiol-disulfide isomerase
VAAYLESDEDRAEVAHADEYARTSGIGGVPFFIFNRKVGLSGAQESDTLLQAMEQASARS